MKKVAKSIAIILLVLIIVSTVQFSSNAETYSGSCGTNISWSFNPSTGVLAISGSGAMTNYSYSTSAPWHSYRDTIKTVLFSGSIKSIGNYTFYDCSSLTNIDIPNSVTSIGISAFEGTSLKKVTIPGSVTSIEPWAFANCFSLTNVTLSNGIKSVGKYAFYICKALTSISIPASLTTIEYGVFNECSSLEKITVDERNAVYHSSDNCLIKTASKELILGCKNSIIPSDGSVTSIATAAFYCCKSLTSITIPNSITSIGDSVFEFCTSLSEVNISDSVKNIGGDAFAHCDSLTNIIIPKGVTKINRTSFDYCNSLSRVTIPENVTSIDNDAFRNNKSLYYLICVKGSYAETWAKSHGFGVEYYVPYPESDHDYANHENKTWNYIHPTSASKLNITFSSKTFVERDWDYIYIYDGAGSQVGRYTGNDLAGRTLTVKGNSFSIKLTSDGTGTKYGFKIDNILPVELSSVSLYTAPNKAAYYVGEALDTTGLQLKLTYDDGSTTIVSSGFTVSGYSTLTTGMKTITVSYEDKSTTFSVITVLPKITLSSKPATMSIGEVINLTAMTDPADMEIKWISMNPDIATVENGKLTGVGEGEAMIIASFDYNSNTYMDSFMVTVDKVLSSVSVYNSPGKTEYYIGDVLNTAGLQLKLTYNNGSSTIISSGFSISGFDSNTAGIESIKVTYGFFYDYFLVRIMTPDIMISTASNTLNVGDTATLIATTTPAGQSVKWTSSDESVVTVNAGKITAVKPGKATITALFSYNGRNYSKTCDVTVSKSLVSVAISTSASKTSFYIGDAFSYTGLQLKLTYNDGSTATVSSGFSVTGGDTSKAGNKTVTVSYGGKNTTYGIEVKTPKITLSKTSLNMGINETYSLTATTDPTGKTVKWSSDNTNIAEVSSEGKITAKSTGSANIIGTFDLNGKSYTASCNVSVNKKLSRITIKKAPIKTVYYIGDAFEPRGLELNAIYDDGSTLTVSSGFNETGFDSSTAGTKTVTIMYGGKQVIITVTVKTPTISLSPASRQFDIGESFKLTATTDPSGQSITWKSSKTDIATVSGGTVTAKAQGSATVTASFTYNGKTYSKTCSVSVVCSHKATETRNAKAATEFEEGYTGDVYCKVCGTKLSSGSVIAKLAHVHTLSMISRKEASCTANGNIAYWRCTVCGKCYSDSKANNEITNDQTVIPALGHSFTNYTITSNATCTSDAKQTAKCDRCNVTNTISVPGSAKGHVFGSTWMSNGTQHWKQCSVCYAMKETAKHSGGTASCSSKAHCSVCGAEYGSVDPSNHVNTEARGAKAATETAVGYTGDIYCKDCGAFISKGKDVPKLDHTHSLTKYARVEPTCTVKGNIKYWYCSKCGKYYSDSAATYETTKAKTVLAALGHSFTNYVYNKDATCTADGSETARCDRCSVTDTKTAPETAKGHSFRTVWSTNNQYHWHQCSECGEKADRAAHSGGEATCVKIATCAICGCDYGEFNSQNHKNTEIRNAVAPTDEKEGYTGDTYCTDCGNLVSKGEAIGKLAHTHKMQTVAAVDSTCTEPGNIKYWKCTKCGKYFSDSDGKKELTGHEIIVPANGHTPGKWEIIKETGTHNTGLRAKNCTLCGTEIKREIIPALINPFTDIPDSSWYTVPVLWCNSRSYISGTSATLFSPDSSLTRAMYVQILAKVAGVDFDKYEYKGKFTDVQKGNWYAKAVQWAIENKITGGTSETTFSPNDGVTREQLAQFFYAYAAYCKYDISISKPLSVFKDAGTTSGWARTAVEWAYGAGLISGTTADTLTPRGGATRAQAAVIFKNFAQTFADE